MAHDAPRASPEGHPSPQSAEQLDAAATILDLVDALPHEVSGVLAFGDEGMILVENRRICWAVANGMSSVLTELLAQRRDPPLPRQALERVYRRCKDEQRPLGLGLVESGLVSSSDVRAAFALHHARAIARLARGSGKASGFHPATPSRDDRRFAFTSAEILCAMVPSALTGEAHKARAHLGELPLGEACALAFVETARDAAPCVLALAGRSELVASQLLSVARWALGLLALGSAVDPTVRLGHAVWAGTNAVITWQGESICYAAMCTSRPASAMLSSALGKRVSVSATSGAWPVTRARSP
jgi:hypothetical protein